jgi:hypothetical protein
VIAAAIEGTSPDPHSGTQASAILPPFGCGGECGPGHRYGTAEEPPCIPPS